MKGLVVAPSAQRQLEEIHHFGSFNFGVDLAERYNADMLAELIALANNPMMPRRSASSLPDVQVEGASRFSVMSFKSHYLFYRETDTNVELLGVQRQGRDLNRIIKRLLDQWPV